MSENDMSISVTQNVPSTEITEEMIKAGNRVFDEYHDIADRDELPIRIYMAMEQARLFPGGMTPNQVLLWHTTSKQIHLPYQ